MDPVQQASATGNLVAIDALGPSGEYRTHNREVIRDTAGMPLAELSIVPALYVARTISAQRKVRPLLAAQRDFAAGQGRRHFHHLGDRRNGLRQLCRAGQPSLGCQSP